MSGRRSEQDPVAPLVGAHALPPLIAIAWTQSLGAPRAPGGIAPWLVVLFVAPALLAVATHLRPRPAAGFSLAYGVLLVALALAVAGRAARAAGSGLDDPAATRMSVVAFPAAAAATGLAIVALARRVGRHSGSGQTDEVPR